MKEWFSFESAVALILVLSVLVVLKSFFTLPESVTRLSLEQDAANVLSQLTNGPLKFLESDQILEEKIRELSVRNYVELKEMLGIESDFCIFFEDSAGNIIDIEEVSRMGSDKILVNGLPCQ